LKLNCRGEPFVLSAIHLGLRSEFRTAIMVHIGKEGMIQTIGSSIEGAVRIGRDSPW